MDAHSRTHHMKHHPLKESADNNTPLAPSAPLQSTAVGASASSYAFITHSQEGLRQNKPPMIDNAGLARRRRRRTSQHDQAILEEEYRKCDRPDKARRREIAAMVEMGDKEVQIWFQNKRQSARRKLKPLLPHEIIPNAMKSSSSPAPAHLRHHHYHHHRAGYSNTWGAERKREGEERNGQEKDEVQTVKKHLDRTPSVGVVGEVVPCEDLVEGSEGERGVNSNGEEWNFKALEQDAEYLGSQDHVFSSQSSSQNHGYYSQQETPARERDGDYDDERDQEHKLPPATVRRMSMSHMRLQEALSSPLPPPPPPQPADAPLTTPQSTKPQRRYSFAREPPSELSEYIHSDFPQSQQTPIKSLPPPPLTLSTPNPRRTNPQGTYQPPTLQKRSSSFLRLSTSLDGHAKVVFDTEPTLPPPLPHDLTTPRRGAPVPSTSSALRDIDKINSKVWGLCCDKQQQPYLSSDGALPHHQHHHHHHHHSAMEPDEAGMALSIVRSRRRIGGSFNEARRKLVFDNAEKTLMRDDSGLEEVIDGPESQRRGLVYDEDGPFGSPVIDKLPKTALPGKKRISLGEVSSNSSSTKPSTYPSSTSTCRKRAYCEIEVYEQPFSSSQPTAHLPPPTERQALPTPLPDGPKKKKVSSPRAGSAEGGGEDYYIFGHESDKENYGEADPRNGEKAVLTESGNQRPVKAMKKPLDSRERNRKSGERVPRPSGVKMNKVKTHLVGGNGTGVAERGDERRVDERRVKKKRRVLGEVPAACQGQKPVSMGIKEGSKRQEQERDVELDLGGAELLLSLSAGRWDS